MAQRADYTAIVVPALKVGLASGGIGFLVGGTAGILKNATPIIFGISSSLQFAVVGSSFWAARLALLQSTVNTEHNAGDLTQASAVAGALSGGLSGLLLRGPKVIIPRTIVMAGLGAGGQMLANAWYSVPERPKTSPGLWNSLLQSSWSPVQTLSDDEYAAMLREKLLRLEVDIAVLDDKIVALKKEATSSDTDR